LQVNRTQGKNCALRKIFCKPGPRFPSQRYAVQTTRRDLYHQSAGGGNIAGRLRSAGHDARCRPLSCRRVMPRRQWRVHAGIVWGGGHRPLHIVTRPPNLSVLLTHCGQLILRKISKLDDTRCQFLRLKCTKFDYRWGSAPDPAGGAYSAPPDPLMIMIVNVNLYSA